MSVNAAKPVDRSTGHRIALQRLRLWFSGAEAALGLAQRRNG